MPKHFDLDTMAIPNGCAVVRFSPTEPFKYSIVVITAQEEIQIGRNFKHYHEASETLRLLGTFILMYRKYAQMEGQ